MYSQIQICVIDDDEEDILLLKNAFKELGYKLSVNYINNKKDILKYITDLQSSVEIFPNLIILDLDMPEIHGTTVLQELKDNEFTRPIPVVIMSHSDLEKDINDCYSLNANGYVVKPQSFKKFKKSIASIFEYWFKTVELSIKGYNFE